MVARTISVMALVSLLLAACSGATTGGEITVTDARVPVPAGANGAAYLTLTNDGDADDELTGAETDVAEAVEIHETSLEDGSMSMRAVDGIEVPAGGTAALEPGGLHLMLVGVTGDLVEGDTVELTLTFAEAGKRTLDAEVVPPGGAQASEPTGMGSEPVEMGSAPIGTDGG